jgi:hypothetical protein
VRLYPSAQNKLFLTPTIPVLILKKIRTLPAKNFTGLLNPPNTPLSVASMRKRGCPEAHFFVLQQFLESEQF